MPTGSPSGPLPAGNVRQGMWSCVHSALKTADPVSASPRGAWPGAGNVRTASKPEAHSRAAPPRPLGAAMSGSESFERQLSAESDFLVAQRRAEERLVPVEFGHVVAQPFEGAEYALPLVRFGAFRRKLGFGHRRPRGSEAFGRRFEHGPAFGLRLVPVRAAAEAQPRGGCGDLGRDRGDRHHRRAEQRDVGDRARHDADRIERLGIDPHSGRRKEPEAGFKPDDAAISRRSDH